MNECEPLRTGSRERPSFIVMVGWCRLKPTEPPELKALRLRKCGRPPMDHCFLTLIYGGGPICTIQRVKATCDEPLSTFAFKFNLRPYIMVDLKSGSCDSDFWIKRGTALLLSLST